MSYVDRTRLLLASGRTDGVLRALARLASKRAVSLTLIATIFIVDCVIPWHGSSYMPRWQGLSFIPRALIDEPCAVATALLVLGAITRLHGAPPDPKFGWSLLAWSVLIDIDHLPQQFGTSVLTEGTPRPYTHALWILIAVIGVGYAARYWRFGVQTSASAATASILTGMAWGIGAHFMRDLATAPMSMWWPFTKATVQVPYWSYMLELLVIVAIPLVRKPKALRRAISLSRTPRGACYKEPDCLQRTRT